MSACTDCGIAVKSGSVRCRSCFHAYRRSILPAPSCSMCGNRILPKGKTTSSLCRTCYIKRGHSMKGVILNPHKCERCGVAIPSHGKRTAIRCQPCYQAIRAESRAARLASYLCLDCGCSISPGKSRCRTCQNRRPEVNKLRIEKANATKQSHADESKMLPNAGRRRAQKLYPQQPCIRCGSPDGVRHHMDRNTFNNAPDNIEWLCRHCHTREHALRKEIGIGSRKRKEVVK